MSAITRIKSDRYVSKNFWYVPNAKQWQKARFNSENEEKSEDKVFDEFPNVKWNAVIKKSDKIELVVNVFREPDRKELGVSYDYAIKLVVCRGPARVYWLFLDSPREKLANFASLTKELGPITDVSTYLNGDNFEAHITVELYRYKAVTISTLPLSKKVALTEVITSLSELQKTGKFSDVSVIVGEKKHELHKSILAARSKYFADYFANNPGITSFEFQNVTPNVFDIFIRYIYTAESTNVEDTTEAIELFKLAHEYQMLELKEIYECLLESRVTAENAMDILCYALKCESSYGLKERAFALVQKQYMEYGVYVPSKLANQSYENIKEFIDRQLQWLEMDLQKLRITDQ